MSGPADRLGDGGLPADPIEEGGPTKRGEPWRALWSRFSLRSDTDHEGTVSQIRADTEFRGGSAWALVFAILIASVGLNVNSTAVIIGAMLISPLMGPIVGAGFALATNDLQLLKQSVRRLALATLVAVTASTLYFTVSPLAAAQSELLARTRPTLYDVLIALFGGGAGAVAVTRKGVKGNAVPGVAIATALMPPLCTVGYGLAQRNPAYVVGALHLFLINALFIGLATLAFIRLMGFAPAPDSDPAHVSRVRTVVALLTLVLLVPSTYTAWSVVREERFRHAARRFVVEQLNFPDRTVLDVDLRYSTGGSVVHATVLGPALSAETLRALEARLPSYGLPGTRLDLRQPEAGLANLEQVLSSVRQSVLDDLSQRSDQALAARETRIRDLEAELLKLRPFLFPVKELTQEVAALHPGLVSIGVGHETPVETRPEDGAPRPVVVASWRKLPSRQDQERLRSFCARRLGFPSVRLVCTLERE